MCVSCPAPGPLSEAQVAQECPLLGARRSRGLTGPHAGPGPEAAGAGGGSPTVKRAPE